MDGQRIYRYTTQIYFNVIEYNTSEMSRAKSKVIKIRVTITIPEEVKIIELSAFSHIDDLKEVIFNAKELEKSYERCFDGLVLDKLIIGDQVSFIPHYFMKYNDLSNVDLVIPSSVVSIGDDAFSGTNLCNVTIKGNSLDSIGEDAFNGCSFSTISIPHSVTKIGVDAFGNNTTLRSVVLPQNLIRMSNGIFIGDNGLSKVAVYKDTKFVIDQYDDPFKKTNKAILEIYGYSNSDAEKFADYKGYKFKSIDEWSGGNPYKEKEEKKEEERGNNSTIVVGQKINLRQTCFADVTDTISRYVVNNTSLAGLSKEMLSGKKPGTVTVYAQKMISRNNYENVAECEVTILSKPKLKFTKNMTYVDQTVNGSDFFLTEDIRTYGATYWESNKPGIVEVTDSENGTLKAKSSGTAKITAYFGEKGKQGTFKISANLAVKIPSYPKTGYSLQTGAKLPIPMKNVNGALDPEWETSEEGIARASAQRNSKGVKTGKAIVEGLSYGDTILIATIDGQNYSCTIHVTAPEINKKAMTLKVGKQGTVSLKKTKIKKADVNWVSDNPEVATVDANGKITALKSGNAIIYTETGGIKSECYVTVP